MGEMTYVLFKDGTCTTAIEDLDPATRPAANPKKWGRWRKRGKEYEITLEGETFAPANQSIREPARRGERPSGRWSVLTCCAHFVRAPRKSVGTTRATVRAADEHRTPRRT